MESHYEGEHIVKDTLIVSLGRCTAVVCIHPKKYWFAPVDLSFFGLQVAPCPRMHAGT
jgi:hypothetical protein